MAMIRMALNLASNGRRLPRLLRRHPLAILPTVGLVLFLSVFLFAERNKHDNLLYAPVDMHEESYNRNEAGNVQPQSRNSTTPPKITEAEDESGYFRLDQAARRKVLSDVCSESNRSPGIVDSLISTSSKYNLTYCPIPRSANTFWLQIFRFLNRDYPGYDPETPFDLDPEEVHSRPFIKTHREFWKMMGDAKKGHLMNNTMIFMSVQDPYMRLWSTYIHALLLPELWESIGQKIEAKRPRPPPQPIAFFHLRQPVRCGHDVTFAEFINYVLESYEKDFAPYYRLCDPCQLKPHYVIKAETSQRDNVFVLKHLALAWTMTGSDFTTRSLRQYVTSIVAGSFKRMKNRPPKECNMTVTDVAHRLWQAFVVEGIIPEGSEQPSLENIDQSQFVGVVLEKAMGDGRFGRLAQKRKFMTAAFRSLRRETLVRVEEKYRLDFRLFDYEREPADIFV